MKITMIKEAGGILRPGSDIEYERMNRFKNGEAYEIDIKQSRNYEFHKKVFAFMNYCFEFWCSGDENLSTPAQFDVFRKNLICLAGYYQEFYNIKGEVRIEPLSISYSGMDEAQFKEFYTALINAAVKNLFQGCDENAYNQLLSFF